MWKAVPKVCIRVNLFYLVGMFIHITQRAKEYRQIGEPLNMEVMLFLHYGELLGWEILLFKEVSCFNELLQNLLKTKSLLKKEILYLKVCFKKSRKCEPWHHLVCSMPLTLCHLLSLTSPFTCVSWLTPCVISMTNSCFNPHCSFNAKLILKVNPPSYL